MEKSHLQTLVGGVSFLLLAFSLLLGFADAFTLSPAVRIGWLVDGRLGSFGSRWCGNESPPAGLDKKTLGERWNVFGNGVIVDMLLHFSKELRCQFHRD